MIEVLLKSRNRYRVKDKDDLVEILAYALEENVEDYMKGVTRRCKMWDELN